MMFWDGMGSRRERRMKGRSYGKVFDFVSIAQDSMSKGETQTFLDGVHQAQHCLLVKGGVFPLLFCIGVA